MRCEECGLNISGLADDAPCTECGVVTPVARRGELPLNMRRVVLGFAWPYMAIAGMFAVLWLMFVTLPDSGMNFVGPVIIIAVLALLVVPINAIRRTSSLMNRLPHRVRRAPLLVMIPRSVTVPLIVGAAAFILGLTVVFGGCMVGAMVTIRS